MRLNKNSTFIGMGVTLFTLLIIISIPKNGTIESLILKKYDNNNFSNMIFKYKDYEEVNFENKEDINNILNELKNINIKEVDFNSDTKETLEIRFYSKIFLEQLNFYIYDNRYIEIISSVEGRHNSKIYEILDKDKLENIIEKLKN